MHSDIIKNKNSEDNSPETEREDKNPATAPRRRYESPVRQQQSAETQERIIAAGAELVHNLPTWDWTNLTAKAVGERAGVSERTVHRYFPTERKLRDVVLQRLVEESGVSLEEFQLSDFGAVAERMFSYLGSFAVAPTTQPAEDPTFADMDRKRRDALRRIMAEVQPGWSERERENAAAVLDILWNLPPYERLIQAWGFEPDRAVGVIQWLIQLIDTAVRQDQKPQA